MRYAALQQENIASVVIQRLEEQLSAQVIS
jgi:hypothetical protein